MIRICVYYRGRFGETRIDAAAQQLGARIQQTVDHCNSDGTGAACLDCPSEGIDTFIQAMDEDASVDSHHQVY